MATIEETMLEQKLIELGLTSERITPKAIDSKIKDIEFYVFPKTLMTICCIKLINDFVVVGQSACAHPENFNERIGKEISFNNARDKIWELEGFLLKQKLFEEGKTEVKR